MIYVLTHEYCDKSATHICGITDSTLVATAWYRANSENNVYALGLNADPAEFDQGRMGWRQEQEERNKRHGNATAD